MRKRSTAGFTLLELIVSLALMALGLVAVLQAVSKGLVASRTIRDYHTAVQLARMQMNETLLLPELPYGTEEGDFGELYPNFRWRTEVESLASDEQSDLSLVTVTVFWQQGSMERSYSLRTLWSESLRDTMLGNAQVEFAGGAGTAGESSAARGAGTAGQGSAAGGGSSGGGAASPSSGGAFGGTPGGGGR